MKVFRFLLLFVLVAFAGCQTVDSAVSFIGTRYTKFEITNYRGELIADWIAEGPFTPAGEGFAIKAVERRSAPPYPHTTKYPNGWLIRITGPHIIYYRVAKPEWLVRIDGH